MKQKIIAVWVHKTVLGREEMPFLKRYTYNLEAKIMKAGYAFHEHWNQTG